MLSLYSESFCHKNKFLVCANMLGNKVLSVSEYIKVGLCVLRLVFARCSSS